MRELIFQMVGENPNGGAPPIQGELLMLGLALSERTISRWMKRVPRDPEPAQRWLTLRRDHREAIAAMDFFAAPTITLAVLYCFFVISHDRRRILHFNVTKHATSSWIIQQLREAFPFESASKFLICDQDAIRVGGPGARCRAALKNETNPFFVFNTLSNLGTMVSCT
jgi:hypothetical protein